MQLFIIGNGFDIKHGLPTSYWNFRIYLENMYPEFLHSFEEHYYLYPRMGIEGKKKLLWNELETNLANIDEDIIIEQATSIDMNLESGDVGIEDTLYEYFTEQYKYIALLAKYLKQWVRTIRIRDVNPKTTSINNKNDAMYITFNYTAVLETVYKIMEQEIIHIHGSLRKRDDEPILGHGNINRIIEIRKKRTEAEKLFYEKEISICKVVENYYERTYKDINKYLYKLSCLRGMNIEEIIVVGHSLAGVDIPYFKSIDANTKRKAKWKVYYYRENEMKNIYNNIIKCGIEENRLIMEQSDEFYDI
ncbi:MAG: bacteriophage abortive infection AbiH family protein [Anaerovorax sp.]|nr:bacteriophage abortive infection AbiH family protein [Anaerovorax sp.]